ncbi:helix-turn-helix domain-containing protein [Streptococcus sp. DD13]|uniref:helix-turn-helix domain-containing protein n=1 Tax=Streptococcus sp. DD13 TaxID=1777881 RepID=UPI00079B76FD|nr:helix-turn-helix domain-containing protein [Streptococcus sp. DD13]KXT77761.1 Transcriptional regulator in cluster with unspecified monosaccharide ABC transport system [Streptococcus sp. DD13]
MRRKSIGEILRETRLDTGIGLREMQKRTNIQVKYLQALEYNDFDAIPDERYIRSFLERYANELDLDSSILLEAFDHGALVAYEEEFEGEDEKSRRSSRKGRSYRTFSSFLPLIYLILLALVIILFITFVIYTRTRQNWTSPSVSGSSYSVVKETSTSLSTTESSSSQSSTSPSSESVSMVTQMDGTQMTVTVSGSKGSLPVSISGKNTTSWISLSGTELSDGVVISSENPQVTTTLPETIQSATLVIGVTEGVTVNIAGQPLDISRFPNDQPATILIQK